MSQSHDGYESWQQMAQALAGQLLKERGGTSCFWRHRWPKWRDFGEYEVTFVLTKASRPVLAQERRCERCNKCQRRLVNFE